MHATNQVRLLLEYVKGFIGKRFVLKNKEDREEYVTRLKVTLFVAEHPHPTHTPSSPELLVQNHPDTSSIGIKLP